MENNNRQKAKKYLVYALMCLICAGCIWFIFSPSKEEKEKQQSGFNSNIPNPKGAEIINDKKKAYEQEQVRLRREEKLKSLDAYASGMISLDEDSDLYARQAKMAPASVEYSGKSPDNKIHSSASNSFQSSDAAYLDINKTLGNFYEEPKEDKEKEALKEEVEELKMTLSQQQMVQPGYDEQIALLEKSYELAAKYMPGTPVNHEQNTEVKEEKERNGKFIAVAVSQVHERVVTSLLQPTSDPEFIADYSKPRNMGFHTAVGVLGYPDKNTIDACIYGNQTVMDGQSVRLRILEAIQAGDMILPKSSLITGICKIEGERLSIGVNSLEYNGMILPVSLTVYDTDGQEGIFIPNSLEISAAKDIAANMGQSLGTSVSITNQSAGGQLLSELGKGAIQGTSQYISQKITAVKVHLKAGYNLMLYQNEK